MLNAEGDTGAAATTIEYVAVVLCLEDPDSETLIVKVDVPVAVGVPDRVPPFESVKPAGRLPADRVQV